MIDGKTGALLELALELGALVGGAADAEPSRRSARPGWRSGRAFQIQDDLLDLTADPHGWGKPIGGDLVEGKRTYLVLTRARGARPRPTTAAGSTPCWAAASTPARVPEARDRLGALGVLDATAQAVRRTSPRPAGAGLDVLPEGPPATRSARSRSASPPARSKP